jgi:hypothetical protein
MSTMSELDAATPSCPLCHQPLRLVPARLSDGSTQSWPECGNAACVDGPRGLFKYKSTDGKGVATAITKFLSHSEYDDYHAGPPTRGEGNVARVIDTFILLLQGERNTTFKYRLTPPNARAEHGYDVEFWPASSKQLYRAQVTRLLPSAVYAAQARLQHRRMTASAADVVAWVLAAVERKKPAASPDVMLLLDGLDAAFLSFAGELLLQERDGILAATGWHSIWLVSVAGLRRLGGNALPPGLQLK